MKIGDCVKFNNNYGIIEDVYDKKKYGGVFQVAYHSGIKITTRIIRGDKLKSIPLKTFWEHERNNTSWPEYIKNWIKIKK